MTSFFFFDNDIEFFTTTSIQKQTGQTQVKSSSFIRTLDDYKKEAVSYTHLTLPTKA